jgi:ABC-type glycerol-3-phosphate transport system substrate-binding protein
MRKTKTFAPLIALAVVLATFLAACGSSSTNAAGGNDLTAKPSHPVVLTIEDAGGFVPQFGQAMVNAFVQANPDQVSKVVFQPRIQAPQLPAKLAAEEAAGHVTDSLV